MRLDERARFAASVQKRTEAQIVLYYNGVSNRTTRDNLHATLQHNRHSSTVYTHTYSELFFLPMCANRTKPIICIDSASFVLNKQSHLRRRYKYRCAASQERKADERALFAGITRTEFMSPIRHFPICIPVRSVSAALRLLPRPPVLEAVHTQAPSSKIKKKLQITRVKL